MFTITDHKGFHITFGNGVAVSVQWGPFNYCEHYIGNGDMLGSLLLEVDAPKRDDFWKSKEAEVAVWIGEDRGIWITPDWTR